MDVKGRIYVGMGKETKEDASKEKRTQVGLKSGDRYKVRWCGQWFRRGSGSYTKGG